MARLPRDVRNYCPRSNVLDDDEIWPTSGSDDRLAFVVIVKRKQDSPEDHVWLLLHDIGMRLLFLRLSVCLSVCQGRAQDLSLGGKTEGSNAESGGG